MSNAIEILITFLTLPLKVINISTAIIKIAIFEMNNFLTRQSLDYTPVFFDFPTKGSLEKFELTKLPNFQ